MGNQDVNAVQRSQEYFRLKKVVQSPGDIYEINESAKAIYIGPDSDIGEIEVTYFNPAEPLGLEQAKVAVNGPFIGRIDSLPKTEIPSTGQPARILITPVDIIDNAYIPPISSAVRRFNIPAVIDVILALRELPAIPAVRADRTLRFPQVPYDQVPPVSPVGNDGSTDLIVPIYGRRMVTITAITKFGADVSLSLVTLQPGVPTVPRPLGAFSIVADVQATTKTGTGVFRASDAARRGVIFNAAGSPPFPITNIYVESDQPPNEPDTGDPQVRGMADLLLINIKQNTDVMAPATLFADVFVKVADREG